MLVERFVDPDTPVDGESMEIPEGTEKLGVNLMSSYCLHCGFHIERKIQSISVKQRGKQHLKELVLEFSDMFILDKKISVALTVLHV